ncbi:MAG: anion permease [Ignavibacteriales bacterium]|nr:anion permease [Ignavibacteriales bacterium]
MALALGDLARRRRPEGLTVPAWHLFALFVAAIVSVIIGALPDPDRLGLRRRRRRADRAP